MIRWDMTLRGFGLGTFEDRNGAACNVQVSSIATEECIWLGVKEPEVTFIQGTPRPFPLPEGVVAFGRMHLNRAQAGELARVLRRFADTGEIAPPRPYGSAHGEKP